MLIVFSGSGENMGVYLTNSLSLVKCEEICGYEFS